MRILGLICKGVLDMERYQITLHSPMGPRRGSLEIVNDREAVVELLGFRSGVAVRRMDGGRFCLTGDLDSIMGKIRFEAKLTIRDGAFDSLARTGKGDMRLTGRLVENME